MTAQLIVFGPGYTAAPIMQQAIDAKWRVFATYRAEDKIASLQDAGLIPVAFDAEQAPGLDKEAPLHILISIAPSADGDLCLLGWSSWLKQLKNIASITYLSSTNVYGDHSGGWVDEQTPTTPSLERGHRRLQAEQAWQTLAQEIGVRLFVLRLAGIYGPGRNAFRSLKSGKARCIIKEGQVFGRIHQQDICNAVWSAMTGNHVGGVFNLADDTPTPPHEVVEHAAAMMGIAAPEREQWDTAELSDMARSFYLENKRVSNRKVKDELGLTLRYPSYLEGLDALYPIDGS